jgi:1-acyl-sn-glycerol-3-phosphate acyltransferase
VIKLFFKIVFTKLFGWKIKGHFPYHLDKLIIVVAPHTSLWDFAIGISVRTTLGFRSNFLAKAELFKYSILSEILTWMGGVPVDRGNKNTDVVGSVISIFNNRKRFVIALAPEGTRSKVTRLKTGFYRIAKEANVHILPVSFDFKNKTVEFLEPFIPSDDMEKDMDFLMDYYRGIQGKNPELGFLE